MFSTFLDRMGATPRSSAPAEVTRASPSNSVLSAITVEEPSNAQSSSSTPPTSIGDSASVSSSSLKPDLTEKESADHSSRRSGRPRARVATYNVKRLTGTAIHTPRKYVKGPKGPPARRRKTIAVDTAGGTLSATLVGFLAPEVPLPETPGASSSTPAIAPVTVEHGAEKDADPPEQDDTKQFDLPGPREAQPRTSIAANSVERGTGTLQQDGTKELDLPEPKEPRHRTRVATYNVKKLTGTAIHTPRKFVKGPKGPLIRRRKTVSGPISAAGFAPGTSSHATADDAAAEGFEEGETGTSDFQPPAQALRKSKSHTYLDKSLKKFAKQVDHERRRSLPVGRKTIKLSKSLSVLGKRGWKQFEDGLSKASRELRKLADTPEFAKIDTQPVIHEVWSNGKLVVEGLPRKKQRKAEDLVPEKPKPAEPEVDVVEKPIEKKKGDGKKDKKLWLSKGLYAGQENQIFGWFDNAIGDKASSTAPFKPCQTLPLPMWHGRKLLTDGRDFKLPFDVCSPLPPGQPKPDEWRKTSSNRFVGDASLLWKKSLLFDSFSSKCVCTPETGCDEDCQNRIMLYECDDTNCGAGRDRCSNRAFANLQERRKAGGKYRIGVEVIKTADRGYGVRSNRCFDPNQIIVEYTGEIITEDECDRRMNEDYKNNECYYLMRFDQGMVLDATKGSIARFINHSCKPNCKMVKWIVGGKPRMALFAGDDPIMTGEELTYDYNFDPFSAKNVQECRCGNDNCRGVLGPKPKDVKPVKETIKDAVKAGVRAGKRKLKALLGGEEEGEDEGEHGSPKKRKIKAAQSLKRSASSASLKMAMGAAKAVKNSLSAHFASARQPSNTMHRDYMVKKTTKASSLKTYGKGITKVTSRKSSTTVVTADGGSHPSQGKTSNDGKRVRKPIVKSMRRSNQGQRHSTPSTIRVISDDEDDDAFVDVDSDDEYVDEDDDE